MSISANGNQVWSGAQEPESSLRDFCKVVFRRKWIMLFFFVVVAGGISAYTIMTPPLYDSEAKLLIKVGRESVALDPSVVGRTVNVVQNRTNEVNSELLILRSRALMEQVVDLLGPALVVGGVKPAQAARAGRVEPTVQRERAVNFLMKSFEAEVARESNVIVLNLKTVDPAVSNHVLNTLLDLYLERHIAIHKTQAKPQFFQDKVAELEKQLGVREKALQDFCSRYGITAIDKQKQVSVDELEKLRSERVEAEMMVKVSTQKIAFLESMLKTRPREQELSRLERSVPSDFIENLKKDLLKLRMEESDLSERYLADDPELLKLRTQVKVLEATLSKEGNAFMQMERSVGQDPVRRDFELALQTERRDLLTQQARQAALDVELARRQADMNGLVARETELRQLQRQMEIAEKEYLEYRTNLQQAQISDALDNEKVSNVSIIHRATLASVPVGLNKMRKILLGLFLGFFGAIALAYLMEHLDHTLRDNRDVTRRLGVPTLITLSPEELKSCI